MFVLSTKEQKIITIGNTLASWVSTSRNSLLYWANNVVYLTVIPGQHELYKHITTIRAEITEIKNRKTILKMTKLEVSFMKD